MTIDDLREFIQTFSGSWFDEKIKSECSLRKQMTTLEVQNAKPLEQMDTDDFQENNLHSKSSTKVKQIIDLKKSVTTGTFIANHLSGNEPGETGSQEKLERFLEKFNSSSQSSLEASQCDALVHALKNKLAVIQGPPGCGKTFIGVKIVEMLLSLSPKLEKPILLLTYKNHALDEFLKHTLRFCPIDHMVRIGSRSKEPELEKCNLKYIENIISYEKATHIEIQNTKTEIIDIEWRIEEISVEFQASSYLTQISLVDELSEEQLQSLIVGAGRECVPPIYRLGERNNADHTWMKQLLNDVLQKYDSVKEFLLMALQSGVSNNNEVGIACIEAFDNVFQLWFPGREELQTLKEFQVEFILQIESDEDASKESQNSDDDDSDEDYVKQLLETRMAAGARHGVCWDGLFDPTNTKNRNDILVNIADYPPDMVVSDQIRSVNNLWRLDNVQRLRFLYCILNEKTRSVCQELNDLIEKLKSLKNRIEELEMTDKVEMLSEKKIIGVTITGASINHDLLHRIGPNVVIVEEAAEILEPSLLAALTTSIEHLILIGDHKQLRPQVDTYKLCRNFQLDVSMMERLIESGFPFRSLAKQNRMRPEFSALLRDIYPDLKDNLPMVSKNKPLKCIEKSMFFWCHDDPEKQDRTYTNVKEAERIIALVMYLLCNDVHPSDITVLSAYLGQTKLLRNMIKREKANTPKFFQEGFVQVQTIDMYQGDENQYILISLVRSNEKNKIGFLNKMNRRCVAQSRAKCGMYFVGNHNTLRGAKNSCWLAFIDSMKEQNCVGDKFPLRCTKHETSKYNATDCNTIRKINAEPTLLCKQSCGDPYLYCSKHTCKKPCHPRHDHTICPEIVGDQFPECGHDVNRPCPQNISDLKCRFEEIVNLSCGHEAKKKCSHNILDVICTITVTATFARCRHKTEKLCHVKIETIKCKHPCEEINSCGKHKCKDTCGNSHGHDCCSEKIGYKFPVCGHPSPKKKKCSEDIWWDCKHKVYIKGACGHDIEKKCHQSESEVKCPITPCAKLRKCGHPCRNACGDDCEKGDCEHCQAVYQTKMDEIHKAAKERFYELEEKIRKKEIPLFSRDELCSKGPTAAEYQKVNDQVMKFIQPCHRWFPTITKIEKITNLELEKKFEEAKYRAFGDYIDTKFHGTSNDGLEDIIRNGFSMPKAIPQPPKKRGMYGQGIYFATDSSKSARDIYTKGSQKLLLCQVILGKSMTVEKADNSLNKKTLNANKCDSVYAPRGTDVMNDEFVIFARHQALPKYIIHFSDSKLVPPSPSVHTQQSFTVKKMKASRSVNFRDPFEMYYHFAESHFRRMAAMSKAPLPLQQPTISSIDIVINKDLEGKFEATKQNFKSQGIPDKEILAYHGTEKAKINSILESNLQLSYAKRQAYGKGNYFSEFPSVSLSYGDGLLLCRILPGKEFVDASGSNIPAGYNSKKVLLDVQYASTTGATAATAAAANVSGEMIIIENSDQILPFFVIHR
ncbi:partial [Paramuricea clavata]|uniref:Partial n=1 Tax=Paramuricea clavata TaxID=317549 RepID=A0A7D9E659_PARCT|nr:partial [Paramuricea clavata]